MGKWGHQDYFKPVYLFHEKIPHAKKCKQKQTNKTKISGTKTTKAAVFCWQKRLRGWKSFVCVWWFSEFFVLFVVFVGAKSFLKKVTGLKCSWWPHLPMVLSQKLFLLPSKKCLLFLLILNSQKLLLEKLHNLRDAMSCHWSLCFLLSRCCLQDAMPCKWSSSDLLQVLRIRESVFYSQAFFTLHSFLHYF